MTAGAACPPVRPASVPATTRPLPLGHLPHVDLATLDTHAALLTRVDRKYVLGPADAADLLGALPAGTGVLEIAGRRSFAYESVYFDTPALHSYTSAAHRRRRRFKVRTRTYLDSGTCWLEVKTRGARGTTVKRREPYDVGDRATLVASGLRFVDAMLAEACIDAVPATDLAPVLTTRYRRSTLHLPGSGARATLDTELEWTSTDGRSRGAGGLVIVETKTGASPSAVDRLLWVRGHRPTTVSKFGTGLAALNPDLPSNRWHRTVRRLDLAA
ncbi:polyphosphate polymerase domain-containing protein [Georgenia sp. MJ206]|uniref:polyphosphate polymerase domain-containing protein n=1 Tax=Georgenia wangjunii TaxID=3117730 RepID=UPI002F262A5D